MRIAMLGAIVLGLMASTVHADSKTVAWYAMGEACYTKAALGQRVPCVKAFDNEGPYVTKAKCETRLKKMEEVLLAMIDSHPGLPGSSDEYKFEGICSNEDPRDQMPKGA